MSHNDMSKFVRKNTIRSMEGGTAHAFTKGSVFWTTTTGTRVQVCEHSSYGSYTVHLNGVMISYKGPRIEALYNMLMEKTIAIKLA